MHETPWLCLSKVIMMQKYKTRSWSLPQPLCPLCSRVFFPCSDARLKPFYTRTRPSSRHHNANSICSVRAVGDRLFFFFSSDVNGESLCYGGRTARASVGFMCGILFRHFSRCRLLGRSKWVAEGTYIGADPLCELAASCPSIAASSYAVPL